MDAAHGLKFRHNVKIYFRKKIQQKKLSKHYVRPQMGLIDRKWVNFGHPKSDGRLLFAALY